MHKIGLSHNGELVLLNHSKDEVQRYMTLYELGADPSRCVAIYRAWMDGTINHDKHPEALSKYRFAGYDFAKRVQRKLRRNRLKAMLAATKDEDREALLRELHTLVGPGVEQQELDDLAKVIAKLKEQQVHTAYSADTNWFIDRVIGELTRRGWPRSVEVPAKPPSDDDDEESNKISMVFDGGYGGRIHGQLPLDDVRRIRQGQTHSYACDSVQVSSLGSGHGGYTRIGTAGDAFVSSFAGFKEADDVLLQLAADVTEVGYVNELLRSNIIRNRYRSTVCFTESADKVRLKSGITGLDIKSNESWNTVDITINHGSLTIQSAQLLINAYRTIEPKVRAILRMNRQRLLVANRFPPTPEEHVTTVGHPVPKKLRKIKLPKISEEEEVNDTENDTA
jgi:hypothetical protein